MSRRPSSDGGSLGLPTTRVISLEREALGAKGSTSLEEVEAAFHEPAKGVFMVRPRVMRRIIRLDQGLGNLAFSVPHALVYGLRADRLRRHVEAYGPAELVGTPWDTLPGGEATVLALPGRRETRRRPLQYFALQVWARRFHAEIHRQVHRAARAGRLDEIGLRVAIQEMGAVAFEEARDALEGEGLLFDAEDDREVLEELLAYFLQLSWFAADELGQLFPSLRRRVEAVEEIARELGLDPRRALETSRPGKAPALGALEERRGQLLAETRRAADPGNPAWHVADIVKHYGEGGGKHEPFLRTLVARLIQQGKVVEELDFLAVRDLAAREGVPLERGELSQLDRALASHFGPLYRRSSLWQRLVLRLRSRDAVSADRVSPARIRTTGETICRMALVLARDRERPPATWRVVARSLQRTVLLWLGGGWLARLYGRAFELAGWDHALRWADAFRVWQLEGHLRWSLLAGRKQRLASAMLHLRRAQRVAQEVARRHPLPEGEALAAGLGREFARSADPVADHFVEEMGLGREHVGALQELIAFLVSRTSLAGGGVEADLLLDIERCYIDGSRRFAEIDLLGWALSLGRRPLVVPLVHHEKMRRLRHLRRARDKVDRLRLPREAQAGYTRLIDEAHDQAARRIRELLGPELHAALDARSFAARDAPSRAALEKIERELLDALIRQGHTQFSDLRDVLARNELKLGDLTPADLARGDDLERLDRELDRRLAGLHRSSEFYLRWLEGLSSVFFGTAPGRVLSQYVLLPVAAALCLLVVADKLAGDALPWRLVAFWPVAATSLALGCLIHLPALRRALHRGLWVPAVRLGSAARWLHRVSPAFVKRWALYPGLAAAALLGLTWLLFLRRLPPGAHLVQPPETFRRILFLAWFLVAFFFIHARMGVIVGGFLADTLSALARAIGRDLPLRLLAFVLRVFRTCQQQLAHLHYLVSDSLRQIQGEWRPTSVAKAVGTLVWWPFAYLLRLYLVLFLEPQVHPLKFPFVSISYKLMIPIYPWMHETIRFWAAKLLPITAAQGLAAFVTFWFCGIFGFLAWELWANWRLYRHNQGRRRGPAAVGSHGETIPRYLRPGFHSGTLPRLFRRLRQARAGRDTAELDVTPRATVERALEEVREDLAHFAERDLLLPVSHHPAFGEGFEPRVREVLLTPSTVTFRLALREGAALTLRLSEKAGHTVASFEADGPWLGALSPAQRSVLACLVAAFYQRADVDLSREELERHLAERWPDYSLEETAVRRILWDLRRERIEVTLLDEGSRERGGWLAEAGRQISSILRRANRQRLAVQEHACRARELEREELVAIYEPGREALGERWLPLLGRPPASAA